MTQVRVRSIFRKIFFDTEEFCDEKHRIPVASSNNKYESILGYECTNIRKDYKDGNLNKKEIKMFEEIPLWFWNPSHKKDLEIKRILYIKKNKVFEKKFNNLNIDFKKLKEVSINYVQELYRENEKFDNLSNEYEKLKEISMDYAQNLYITNNKFDKLSVEYEKLKEISVKNYFHIDEENQ